MSLSVLIDGVERKQSIDQESLEVEDNLTSQVDVCQFTVTHYRVSDWTPAVGSEIVVYDGTTKAFGGYIVNIESIIEGAGVITYKVTAKDYTYLMDGKIVFKEYTNVTVESIIADIVSTFLPAGFTTTHVSTTGVTVTYIIFNYEQPSKCLQALADLIGYDWYVDSSKDIHFFDRQVGETAAFNLIDTDGNYLFNTLQIKEDNTQLRNVIYVRGGEYAGDSRSDKVGTGDGTTTAFPLPYRYNATPTVTAGGVSKTVGVDFLDNPASFDSLWNYQEKVIKFTVAPASGAIIVTGVPMIAVIVKSQTGPSIAANGTFEYLVLDKTIVSKEAARLRAQAEMDDYAYSVKDAQFDTYNTGLRSGQKINIQSDKRGINIDFIITRVVSKIRTEDTFMYSVTCSTVRNFGIISFLQKQLVDVNRKVGVIKQEGEIMDIISNLENIDTFTVTDHLLYTVLNSPDTWYAGPYYPTSDSDRVRAPYADTHVILRV